MKRNSLSTIFRCSNGIRKGGQSSPLLSPSNKSWVLCRRCTGKFTELCDDMVLLVPTVTALQTLLEACRAYAGPHDTEYNTTKTVCMPVRPKQLQGRYSTRVRLINEELSFVAEFRYLGHVMTADCRDDKDNKKIFRS